MNDVKLPRMETIADTAKLFGLPKHLVRSKVLSGEIIALKVGRKYLVNVDKFAEYLNTSRVEAPQPVLCSGIHPVPLYIGR